MSLFYIDLDIARTPRDGRVLTNRYWVIHPDKGLTFYRFGRSDLSPQCNANLQIVTEIRDAMYPDHEIGFMDVVFLGP